MGVLIRFARPQARRLTVAGLLAGVAGLLSIVPFWAIYRLVDEVSNGESTQRTLAGLAAVTLSAIVARFVLFGAAMAISHAVAFQMLYDIRIGVAEHLAVVPLGEIRRRRSGELKKVIADDVERMELWLAHGIPDAVAGAVVAAVVPIWLFAVDWRMAIATLIVILPAFLVLVAGMKRMRPVMPSYQASMADMNASIVELVRGMPVVRVFNRTEAGVRDAEDAIARHSESVEQLSRGSVPLLTGFSILMASNVAVILPLGLWLNARGSLSDTDLLFFLIVGLGAIVPLSTLLSLFAGMGKLVTSGRAIDELLHLTPLPVGEESGSLPLEASLEFVEVSFGYGDVRDVHTPDSSDADTIHYVIHDASFRLEPGTVTALVGPSGSGKSTVAALAARFWDVDGGRVLVGGTDVRSMPPDELGRHVSMVMQDPILFDDTVGANVRAGRPEASDADVWEALEAAQAASFVGELPGALEAAVGERGGRLSGGERQRLTLARAMLADTPIVVLDEATSFADPENEALIQDAIGELIQDKTVLIVAHRLATIAGVDQILVLAEGRIVERGQHAELLEVGGRYADMWNDSRISQQVVLGDAVRSLA